MDSPKTTANTITGKKASIGPGCAPRLPVSEDVRHHPQRGPDAQAG
jgi:hypothetical protein